MELTVFEIRRARCPDARFEPAKLFLCFRERRDVNVKLFRAELVVANELDDKTLLLGASPWHRNCSALDRNTAIARFLYLTRIEILLTKFMSERPSCHRPNRALSH
jgi:hypothetical protein